MHRFFFIWLVIEGFLMCQTFGSCSTKPPNAHVLTELDGSITYSGSSTTDDCGWIIPPHPNGNYALVLKLRSISMQYESSNWMYCSGYVDLPETELFCDKPRNACFMYGLRSQCSYAAFPPILSNFGCSETSLYMRDRIPRKISLLADRDFAKTFTINYKYVKCSSQDVDEVTSFPQRNGSQIARNKVQTEKNETDGSQVSKYAFSIVIALLVVLLIISLVTILWIQRRNKRLVSKYEKPPSVQYSPSNPEGQTPTTAQNQSEGSENPAMNNRETPLHGEASRQTTEIYSEIKDRHQDAGYSPETSQNIENSGEPPLQLQPNCVYATVNKNAKGK